MLLRRKTVWDTNYEELHEKAVPFCNCYQIKRQNQACICGEEATEFEWLWDEDSKSSTSELSDNRREVKFHQRYSSGTAAARGDYPMKSDQYYWELKMVSPVYGTDMMVGVGTANVNLKRFRDTFFSLLGSDNQSWGLSYTGMIHHKGEKQPYAPRFGQGSIIGIHLDSWNGTLTFYNNRQSLGVAFSNLHGQTLYPMVSSTAAKSKMRIIKCHSCKTSLQYLCVQTLRKEIPGDKSLIDALNFPPGLRLFLENNMDWLVSSVPQKTKPPPPPFPHHCSYKRVCCDGDEVPISYKRSYNLN